MHRALVAAAAVPADDRFQVVEQVAPDALVWDAAYLGQKRTPDVVFVQIFLNVGRTIEVKKALYAAIANELGAAPGLRREDVLVNLVEVAKENWSFGLGQAQYADVPPPHLAATAAR